MDGDKKDRYLMNQGIAIRPASERNAVNEERPSLKKAVAGKSVGGEVECESNEPTPTRQEKGNFAKNEAIMPFMF
jgi:hypothetical protein